MPDFEEQPQSQGRESPRKIPEELGMELVLAITKSLYTARKTVKESVFERVKSHGALILDRTSKSDSVRQALGHSSSIWKDMNAVFSFAIPVLEVQSIAIDDPVAGTPGCCSALMVSNYDYLTSDLIRLNDILVIARNCLATTPKAQNLAGESLLDQQVLKLIDLCVRVTARGYDGEAGGGGTKAEKLWTNIIGLYKKLLITCLQFLHNFITQNEQRKLLLWLDLFANSRIANEYVSGAPHGQGRDQMRDLFEAKLAEVQHNAKANGHAERGCPQREGSKNGDSADGLPSTKLALHTKQDAEVQVEANGSTVEANVSAGSQDEESQITKTMIESTDKPLGVAQNSQEGNEHDRAGELGGHDSKEAEQKKALENAKTNFGALRSPESAAVTLKAAKDQLMARLKESASITEAGLDQATTPKALDAEDPVDGGPYPDEEDDEYRDQGELGDQTRGLLTDIPLVLGPQEIEALPMIIQIAICPGLGSVLHGRDMQSLRCNILLAGEAGRNLLRELLIFIAAWDLQDDEAYFLLMKQIMEAILENGLMPYAYQTFAEVKDIVSPAQSMVIKILTQIFRGKHGLAVTNDKEKDTGKKENPHADASRRVDIYIVRYIFTMFRSSIIPETCALIYLQGQIKGGAALPEDFPLNLWDMERVYEGVYQFLEFFAVLTESEEWKDHLVTWEIVSELVTLLRELDGSIPKAPLAPLSQSLEEQQAPILQKERLLAEAYAAAAQNQKSTLEPDGAQPSTVPIVAVERPYSPISSPPATIATAPAVVTKDAYAPPSPIPPTSSEADAASIESADPADFEWRNLKKLVILVLSSLVWKSPKVQNQIRQYGGVELVLGCCNYDGHNPYIREHAVMCLRFLLEGNVENQDIIRERMARREGLGGVLGEDLAGEVLGKGGLQEEGEEEEGEGQGGGDDEEN